MQDGVSVAETSVEASNSTGLQNGDCNTGRSGGDGSSQLSELVTTSSTNKTGKSCSDTVSLPDKDKLVNAILKNCMLIRALRTSAAL